MFGNDFLFLQRLLQSLGYYKGDLDGDFGPLTDAALDEFEVETAKIADNLGRFDPRSERNIATLHIKTGTCPTISKGGVVFGRAKNTGRNGEDNFRHAGVTDIAGAAGAFY